MFHGKTSLYLLTFLLLVRTSPALASNDAKATFRGSAGLINAANYYHPTDSRMNPDNSVYAIPNQAIGSEFRLNLKMTVEKLSVIARPKFGLALTRTAKEGKSDTTEIDTSYLWTETFGQWTLSDQLSIALGKQNFQWGPAESLSPSNRLFHDVAHRRSLFHEPEGKQLARANISFGKTLSVIVMGEVEDNREVDNFLIVDEYEPISLLKTEYNWNSGADYLGIVFGGQNAHRPWIGEYVNLELLGGFTSYLDVSHTRGSDAYYPQQETPLGRNGPVSLRQSQSDSSSILTIAVGGLRYAFERGDDVRIEYIHNSPGYNKEQYQDFLAALGPQTRTTNPDLYNRNLRISTANGLEVPGRRYLYLSWRCPDCLTKKDFTFFSRLLRSLQDQSTSGFASAEYKVGDAGTAFLAASGSAGDRDTELQGLTDRTYAAGYRHDW